MLSNLCPKLETDRLRRGAPWATEIYLPPPFSDSKPRPPLLVTTACKLILKLILMYNVVQYLIFVSKIMTDCRSSRTSLLTASAISNQ